VKELREENKEVQGVRIEVSSGGCHGFQTKFFTIQNPPLQQDIVFGEDNAKFVIDPMSLKCIEGSQIIFSAEMMSQEFLVQANPNSQEECSCHLSFAPKPGLFENNM